MGRKPYTFFIVLVFVFSLVHSISFAQQFPFTPRENAIFTTLNQLQKKEEAIIKTQFPFTPRENAIFTSLNQLEAREQAMQEAVREAEIKLREGEESRLVKKKGRGFNLKGFVPRMHPYLDIENNFYDNIYSAAEEKKSDFVYSITPGVKMNFGRFLNLDLSMGSIYYHKHPLGNAQNIDMNLRTNFRIGRYTLSMSDDYFNNYVAIPELGTKKDQFIYYWKNTFSSALGRHFNRIGFDVGYSHTDYEYEDDYRLGNHFEETYSFNQFLRIAKKTQLLLGYEHGRAKYPRSPSSDSNSNDFSLVIFSVLSPRLSGSSGIGYSLSDPKEGSDSRDTILNAKIGYNISSRSDLAFSFERTIHESATKSAYSIDNSFGLTANHRLAFNPKLNLSFSSGAAYTDYPKLLSLPNPQKDAIYTLGLGLSYAFRRWLDFSLGWSHKKSESNVAADYYANTITFTAQAKF